jgi:hypothetical protein
MLFGGYLLASFLLLAAASLLRKRARKAEQRESIGAF